MSVPGGDAPQPPQVVIKVPEDMEAGVYAQGVNVASSFDSFCFDFLAILPGTNPPMARVVSRVLIPPAQAAEILKALSVQMQLHEDQFGPIKSYPGHGLTGPTDAS